MNTLLTFYNSRISCFEQKLKKIKKKLFFSSMLRLFIFLLTAFLIFYFIENLNVLIPVLLSMSILFLVLVLRHSNLQYKKERFKKLVQINKKEIAILNRNFSDLPEGTEFKNASHYYSADIDLFGKRSFFQYLNRTNLNQGKKNLAELLLANDVHKIEERQKAISELGSKVEFRQEFSATAGFVENQQELELAKTIFQNYRTFSPNFAKWLPLIFSFITVGIACGWYFDFISGYFLFAWGIIGFIIQKIYSKKTNQLATKVASFQNTFRSYHRLLEHLEETDFSSKLLQEKRANVLLKKEKASVLLKKFSKNIDSLEQGNVFIFGALANLFFLWDFSYAYKLENWIKNYGNFLPQWIESIEFMDAFNSLGNFAYNHPTYTYPIIQKGKLIIAAENAVHPLVDPLKSVKNNFQIEKGQFFILTGANMAGKSTFLRTVSLQIVMSNVGLPINASSCTYSPIKLITSMRTSDSLSEDTSYFHSELKRLKFIVDELQTDQYFIVLDEILKGTNSQDKAIGSRKFVEKLIKSKSTGIIATHDLSLCETANSFSEIKNYYFDVEIIEDNLHFDYTIHKGICKNMNASFLLKKMGITD